MGKMKSNENATTLAKNLRALRLFFGENQADLASILNCKQNAISQYELDSEDNDDERHIPTAETLKIYAQHFGITVYQLENFDYEYLGDPEKYSVLFYQNIDTVFPIVCTERALKNKSFKAAYQSHLDLYKHLKSVKDYKTINDKLEAVEDNLCEIICHYHEALKNETIKAETSINILGCYSFDLSNLTNTQTFFNGIKHKHAISNYWKEILKKRFPKFEDEIKNLSTDDKQELISQINERINERQKEICKLRLNAKEKYPDLIYYYLALQYYFNFADNDNEQSYNRQIGLEMMDAFKAAGNKYAIDYLES